MNELFEMLRDLTGKSRLPRYVDARPGEVLRSILDATAAGRKLGWKPWTSLEEGLRRTVEYFESQR